MAARKPSYLSPRPAPMTQTGQVDAVGAAHYQSLPSWETNVPTNAGPGPAAIASPQWKGATGPVPAGPHVPGVWVQQYGGIDNYGIVRSTYGDVYAGPPTATLAWTAHDGWQYAIYSDYSIKVLRSAQHGTVPEGALNGTTFQPGSKEHYAIVKQWFNELSSHPVGSSTQVFMQRAAAASKAAGGGGESLVSTLRGAVSSMVAVVTGSTEDVPAPPPPPPAPVVQYVPAPDGSMVPVPTPPVDGISKVRKAAPFIGGGLLALAAFGGLYWYFSGSQPRTNGDDDDKETP